MNQDKSFIEEEKNFNKLVEAKDFVTKLRLELALRPDNEHVGSGLGGNISEFMFLVCHDIKVISSNDNKIKFSGAKEITISVPEKPNLKEAREELSKFIESHVDKLVITKEQAINISFIQDLKFSTLEKDLLIKGLKIAHDLVIWLDPKIRLQDKIAEVFDIEYKDVEGSFLKEMNLPSTYFKDQKDKYNNPVFAMFNKHPIWSAKNKEIIDRQNLMEEQLLSSDDITKMNLIGTLPAHLAVHIIRLVICVDRLVKLNLDEKFKFLSEVNKQFD